MKHLIAIAIAMVALYVFLSWYARRAPYFPMRYPAGFWEEQARLGAQDVWLTAADGVRLHAWWIGAPDARLATLFLHGNAGNITHRDRSAREIVAAGSAVLLLDYRGYGKSAGTPSEWGLYADADAAWRHVLEGGFDPRRIVIHGESLGSAVAVDLASRVECAGVILEAPFSSGSAVASRVLPVAGPLVFRSFNSIDKIRRVRAPVLVIHGERDDIIDISLADELYQAANEPKSFWRVPGAGHNDLIETAGAAYRKRLAAFYASLTGAPR